MSQRQLTLVMVLVVVGMAVGFLGLLLKPPAVVVIERRLTDYAAERAARTLPKEAAEATETKESVAGKVNVEGRLATFDGKPGPATGSWPRFRGKDFSNSVPGPPVLERWPEGGPPTVWRTKVGQGYAGPVTHQGRVFLLDYDEKEEGDSLRVFSLADGQEIWRRTYKAPIKKNHGFSRTVPAVTDDYVVTLGPRCVVMCNRPATGEFLWGIDLVFDYGTEVPLWYSGQCPLIDDGIAVLAPGGKALLMGVDCATGKIVWQAPNLNHWNMSHSSVVPATLLGRKMYVYSAKEGMVGVAADGQERGQVLWQTTVWAHSVTSPSPLPIDDRRIFVTAGYGGGSMMLGFKEANGKIVVEPLYELEKTVFSCEQHTPLLYQNHLFTVLPKDAGEFRAQFACMNLEGKVVWTSGKTERFGLGPFLRAGDDLFILDDDGTLSLIRAATTGYERLARARVLHGREAWAPMALVDGRLILRDFEEMICLEVRADPQLTLQSGKGS
jgi:outer membrane protein assembly factor BamB